MFCRECGKNIGERKVCPYCGCGSENEYLYIKTAKNWEEPKEEAKSGKSRFIAAVLQIFTGSLGLGRFYMGFPKTALLQILVSLITFGIGGFIWGVIDAIAILSSGTVCDGNGAVMEM